jgi:hypothetical protein
VEYEDFHDIMGRWLTDLADQMNIALQELDNGLAIDTTTNVSASPSHTVTIPVLGMTTFSIATASIASSTNPVTIFSITPTAGNLVILLSGDPGASITINYSALVAT